jgi:hypothetical protein
VSFFEPPPPPPRGEPPEVPQRRPWWGAPGNELGAPLPLRLVVARSERVVIAVMGVTAYSTGMEFTLAVRRRPQVWAEGEEIEEFYDDDPFDPPFGHPRLRMRRQGELPPELLRFGVQFSDGRKATTVGARFPWGYRGDEDENEEPEGPVLIERGGSGGGGDYEQDFWLWPVPPPGPLTFAIEWPSEKIELTRREVDAALFIETSRSSEELWPEASSDETSTSRQFVIGTDYATSEPGPNADEQEELAEADR